MATDLRKTGIDVISQMPWGTHFCLFYENQDDLLNVVVPYLKAGLEDNEFCVWVVADPLTEEDAWRALSQVVPAFERHRSNQSIELFPARDWYLNVGHFELERVTSAWNRKLTQALARGYAGMRVSGDTLWLEKKSWKSFLEYENQLDKAITDQPMTILCTYPLASSGAAEILDVARSHQFTLARRGGAWEQIETPELKQAKAEIKRLNEQLERSVVERTVQLAATNEQLKLELIERKQAEALLHAREQEFRAIVENAPDQIIRYDREFHRTYVNPAVAKAFGLPAEALIGRPIGSIVQDAGLDVKDDEVARFRQRIAAVFDTGESYEFENNWPMPTGRRHYTIRLFPERDINGSVINVLGIARDITERKQAEEALRQSESNFRTLADKSLEGIQLYQGGRSVYANAAMTALLGYTQEELRAMSMEEHIALVHPLDRAIAVERARKRQAGQELPASLEVRLLTKAGATRWVQGFTNEIEYNGQPAILSTAIDITERKLAEDELRTQKEILQKIFDHTPMMIGMIGVDGQWQMINRAWERTMGWTLEELQQPNFDVLAEVYPDPGEHQRVLDFIAAPAGEWEEFKARVRDGRVLDVTFTNVRLSDGTTLGFGLDITERKRAEEATKHQAARAETLARIAARLNKQLDLEAVIHAVCEEAINIFKVSQATMSLYDKKRDLLVYAGGVNIPPEYAASMEPITRSQFDDFLQAIGPIIVIPDIQSLPDVPNAEFSSHLNVRTVVTAAMLRDQELVGVLVVGINGHVREFDQDELTLLKAISDQAAQAIANALLLKAANEQHEQLRALSAKLVEAQEVERQALTTELHDRVGQNLTGLSINLQNMKALLSNESAKTLTTKFDDAQALVEHTTRQIRDIMAELHPPELEDYGLAAALEAYGERAASRGNLELISDLPDLAPPPLPSDALIALFRAAQEAITNVLKHADATQLELSLEESDGGIRLRVEDDGRGFEPDSATQKEAQTWGLKIMRERIESIGGKVQIESEPEAGTRVTFEIERPS